MSQSRIDSNVKLHEITYFKLHWWMITDIAVRLNCSNMQMLRFNISHFEFDSPLYLIASTIWMKWGDNKNVHGTTLTVCGFFMSDEFSWYLSFGAIFREIWISFNYSISIENSVHINRERHSEGFFSIIHGNETNSMGRYFYIDKFTLIWCTSKKLHSTSHLNWVQHSKFIEKLII